MNASWRWRTSSRSKNQLLTSSTLRWKIYARWCDDKTSSSKRPRPKAWVQIEFRSSTTLCRVWKKNWKTSLISGENKTKSSEIIMKRWLLLKSEEDSWKISLWRRNRMLMDLRRLLKKTLRRWMITLKSWKQRLKLKSEKWKDEIKFTMIDTYDFIMKWSSSNLESVRKIMTIEWSCWRSRNLSEPFRVTTSRMLAKTRHEARSWNETTVWGVFEARQENERNIKQSK